VKLSLYLINEAICHLNVWWSGCIDPHFLVLGTNWRWVGSFMLRGKWPLDRRLGRPQSWSGRYGGEKILDSTEARTPTAFSQSLYQVHYPSSNFVTVKQSTYHLTLDSVEYGSETAQWYSERLWAGWSKNWGSIPCKGKRFLFSTSFRLALGHTHLPLQWIPETLPSVKVAEGWDWPLATIWCLDQ
jgi:hypothetical protein